MKNFLVAEQFFSRDSFRVNAKEFTFVSVPTIVRCARTSVWLQGILADKRARGRAKIASSPLEYPTQLCDTKFLTGKDFKVTGKEVNHRWERSLFHCRPLRF